MKADERLKEYEERRHRLVVLIFLWMLGIALLVILGLTLYTRSWSGLLAVIALLFFLLLSYYDRLRLKAKRSLHS